MEHAGEGHYSVYLDQEHTGLNALKGVKLETHEICGSLGRSFKRYDRDTSSPSDPTSIIFGVYHSPVSGTYVTSSIRKMASDSFRLMTTGAHDWAYTCGMPAHQRQMMLPIPQKPIFLQSAIFSELVGTIAKQRLSPSLEFGSHDPIAVHLEVDLFTYRTIIMFAESHGLCLRFFPIPTHHQFDTHKALFEESRKNRQTEAGKPNFMMEGFMGDLRADKLPRYMRYPVVAYCPACAKLLPPDTKLQCKQCKIAFYCNVECQKKDWHNLHRQECRRFSKLAADADCEYCKKVGTSYPIVE